MDKIQKWSIAAVVAVLLAGVIAFAVVTVVNSQNDKQRTVECVIQGC